MRLSDKALRSQLLFLCLLMGMAGVGSTDAGEDDTAVIASIREAGGVVLGGNSNRNVRFSGTEAEPTTAEHLSLLLKLGNVRIVSLRETELAALRVLEPIATDLERFSVNSRSLSDEWIPVVNQFQNVTWFGMRTDAKEPPVTPEGMRQLQGFPKVEGIGVGGHSFPPECLALLPEIFPNALEVDFNHTFKINTDVFAAFKKFNNLQKLNLGGCYQSDEATMRAVGALTDLHELSVFHAGKYQWATLEALRGHPNLRSLRIGDSRGRGGELRAITDADLEVLKTIPNFERFGTGGDPNGGLTDDCGKILAQLPNLKSLTLSRPEFTGQLLKHLASAPRLEELICEFDNLSAEDLKTLHEYSALKKLRIGGFRQGSSMDDAKLDALHGIPALESLDIRITEVSEPSDDAVKRLKAAWPEADVRVQYGLDYKKKL